VKASLFAALAGLVFGVGLIVSGMIVPAKVQGFLDFGGAWDPSLAFVMGGAVTVHFVAMRLIRRRARPLFDRRFHLPTRKDIDKNLVVGAAVFGVGWGLGGFCPGPGLVSGASLLPSAGVFVVAMLAGMWLEARLAAWRASRVDARGDVARDGGRGGEARRLAAEEVPVPPLSENEKVA